MKKKVFRCLTLLLVVALLLGTAEVAAVGSVGQSAIKSAGDALLEGDFLYFGSYEGQELVWQVIHEEDGNALLFCHTPFLSGQFEASINKYTAYPSPTAQVVYGSSSWRTADLRTFLNSTADNVEYSGEGFDYSLMPYGAIGTYDDNNSAPSYAGRTGFLNEQNFAEEEVALLEPVTRNTLVPHTDPEHQGGDYTPQSDTYGKDGENAAGLISGGHAYVTVTDYVYSLSVEEAYQYLDYSNNGGKPYLSWKGESFWLRDPLLFYSTVTTFQYLYVGTYQMAMNDSYHHLGPVNADTTQYIRPACNINLAYIEGLSGSGTEDDPYRLSISADVLSRSEYIQGSVYREHPSELAITVQKNPTGPQNTKPNFVLAAGVQVEVGEQTFTTDKNGQVTIPYPVQGATFRLDGYVTRTISGAQLEGTPEVYLQKESDYPAVNAVWADNVDVLHKSYSLDVINSGTQTVRVEVDWGKSECSSLVLRQGANIVDVSGKSTRLTWSDHFDISEEIVVVATNTAGKTTRLPLKLEVATVAPEALNGYAVKLGNNISVTLGDDAGRAAERHGSGRRSVFTH